LKDKTRSEAIADVKQVWKKWIAENAQDSDLAKKIIWKSI
jgi:predicted RNase H-like HicB family nuclease